MSDMKACEHCKHWEKNSQIGGECRRYAPQGGILRREDLGEPEADWPTVYAAWPSTIADDWCGEFTRDEFR